jgi:putative intracellular protease/amidase
VNLINKVFNVSQRCAGTVDENGFVIIQKINSYDLVGVPGFTGATMQDLSKLIKEEERQKLLKSRREKIDKLNNI